MGQKSSYGGKIGILYIDFVLLGASLLFFFCIYIPGLTRCFRPNIVEKISSFCWEFTWVLVETKVRYLRRCTKRYSKLSEDIMGDYLV